MLLLFFRKHPRDEADAVRRGQGTERGLHESTNNGSSRNGKIKSKWIPQTTIKIATKKKIH